MASTPATLGGQMGDCAACMGKTMKPSALCDELCNAPVAIALVTSAKLEAFPLLADYGIIPDVKAEGRIPGFDPSPPRTTALI